MTMTDPVADMLTRIRNGLKARFEKVDIPTSTLKVEIARILKEEGYINDYKVKKTTDYNKQGVLRIYLKYDGDKNSIISGIKRVSKPGLRIYSKKDSIPRVMDGLGIAILTTPKGVLTDKKAKEFNTGGEVLCYVW